MQIITVAVIKGGTGKTTTAAALAQAAASAGKRILAIDLDPQGNLSFTLSADTNNRQGSYQLLHEVNPLELIQQTPQGIDCIAASPDLATEKTKAGSVTRLQKALEPIKRKYDYIIIDTPPIMAELTFNALQAATGLIIPLEIDNYSIQGLYQITDIAHQIQQHNKRLKILGTVITRYDARPKINRYLKNIIEEKSKETGTRLLGTIRKGVAVTEAQAMQLSLYDYAPHSKPAKDYKELYNTITKE